MQKRMPEEWYAENVRLSLLGVTDWIQRPVFNDIAGVPPAMITSQPLVQIHQEAGDLSDGYLNISQQANRIDVVLSDKPNRNRFDPSGPDYRPLFWIGPYRSSIESFDAISVNATSLVKSAARAAYAITLIRKTESVRESVTCLREHLPTIDFDPNNDLDLIFQINRPIRDKRGILINRLAKWESIQMTTLQVAINVAPLPAASATPPTFAARIYVDVSTDAANTLPLTDLSELVGELRDYAANIVEKGDSR